MKYSEWLNSVPDEMREDSLWKMEAYRLALFAGDLGRHVLATEVMPHRIGLLTETTRLLLRMVPDQRRDVLRNEALSYQCSSANGEPSQSIDVTHTTLFENVPMP